MSPLVMTDSVSVITIERCPVKESAIVGSLLSRRRAQVRKTPPTGFVAVDACEPGDKW